MEFKSSKEHEGMIYILFCYLALIGLASKVENVSLSS